jgi:hypothetical protein
MNDLNEPTRINTFKSGYEGQGIVETYSDEPELHYTRLKNGKDHWTLKSEFGRARIAPEDDARVQPPQY